ncbi:unnamed protein product [Vicia faba]|uniref:Uncharacterized protein n=1 Tax=Vicia faba TaxID=3906 RepID=A0AAV1BAU5_VICFA|nr:unnamed protein product [Vicia faba]
MAMQGFMGNQWRIGCYHIGNGELGWQLEDDYRWCEALNFDFLPTTMSVVVTLSIKSLKKRSINKKRYLYGYFVVISSTDMQGKFRDRQQHWTVPNNSIAGIVFEWFGQVLARIWQVFICKL